MCVGKPSFLFFFVLYVGMLCKEPLHKMKIFTFKDTHTRVLYLIWRHHFSILDLDTNLYHSFYNFTKTLLSYTKYNASICMLASLLCLHRVHNHTIIWGMKKTHKMINTATPFLTKKKYHQHENLHFLFCAHTKSILELWT